MIPIGSRAPEFTALREDGSRLSLSELRGRVVVLYFFPKAGTPGCTRETEGFVERYRELQARGVDVVGISVDSVIRQGRFAADCQVPFPLLSDSDHTIARAYGVLGILGLSKRVTFVLDAEGVVIDVIAGLLPGPHVRGVVDRFLTPAP
ncbi:MAG: peroxiredoxin [Thermoplasmata archaeon]|jgi:peroxiredoxin Q/BCP